MFILRCKDLGILNCSYCARHLTEEKTILLTMDHLMKTHPEQVRKLVSTMTQADVIAMIKVQIKKEIISRLI